MQPTCDPAAINVLLSTKWKNAEPHGPGSQLGRVSGKENELFFAFSCFLKVF
jgi:hypothetical protein